MDLLAWLCSLMDLYFPGILGCGRETNVLETVFDVLWACGSVL